MEKKTLDFLRELNPDLVKSDEIQFAIDKWYATKDFEKKIVMCGGTFGIVLRAYLHPWCLCKCKKQKGGCHLRGI